MKTRTLLTFAAALAVVSLCQAQTAKKISEWPTASTVTGSDSVLGNQGGATKQIPISVIGALFQPIDADLTAIAALTTTSYGRGLLTGADATATRVTLGLGSVATLSIPAAGVVLSDGSGLSPATLSGGLRLTGSTLTADRVSSLWDTTDAAVGLTVDDGGIVLGTGTIALVPNSGGLVIYGFGTGLQLGGGAYKLGFYGATPIDRPGGNALTGLVSLGLMGTATLAASDISSGTLAVARGGTGTGSPALVAGTNITITGTWPNQTINSTASSAWADITGKPTTLAGYGISDGITAAAVASGYQPLDSDLTAIAALTTTSYGRALLELANAAAGRTALGLAIGTDVQAYNATLAAVAGGTYSGATSITTLGTIATGTVPWARLSGTPTTVSGYGITDALSDTLQNIGDANTTISAGTTVAVVNTTWTATRTMTLPAASGYPAGRGFIWVDPAGNANYRGVTFSRAGSDTIVAQDAGNTPGSSTSVTFSAGGYVYRWFSDGTSKWFTERNASTQYLTLTTSFLLHAGSGYTQIGDTNNYWRAIGANTIFQPSGILKWNSASNLNTGSVDTGFGRTAAGILETNSGTAGGMGRMQTGWVVTAKTSNYTVLLADKGTFFTNTGASGSVNFTLPTAQAGLQFSFYIDASQTVTVTAGASTTIRIAGTASATAGNITASTVGNVVRLMAISSTQWVAESHEGTWTIN